MRDSFTWRVAPFVSAFCLFASATRQAAAQAPPAPAAAPAPAPAPVPAPAAPLTAPPPAPPGAAPAAAPAAYPGYPPPPPGYAYPPYPTYPTPIRMPDSVPYTDGPVPHGFHVEERPRRGLIIAGSVVLGVPWVLSLTFASGSNFPNQSGWLVVPALGPWITLAARHSNGNCGYTTTSSGYDSYNCPSVDDDAMRTILILDGLTQGAGAIMLIVGLATPKKVIARDFVGSLHFAPSPIGKTGYGGFVTGQF